MSNWLTKPLPGHKYFASGDTILEWREPTSLQKSLTLPLLRGYVKQVPKVFAVSSVVVFGILLLKAAASEKPFSEIHLLPAVLGSALLGTFLCLSPLARIAIRRWNPVTVRLASQGLARFTGGFDDLHCAYGEVKAATVGPHPLEPNLRAIILTMKNGNEAALALPVPIDEKRVLEILSQHGIECSNRA